MGKMKKYEIDRKMRLVELMIISLSILIGFNLINTTSTELNDLFLTYFFFLIVALAYYSFVMLEWIDFSSSISRAFPFVVSGMFVYNLVRIFDLLNIKVTHYSDYVIFVYGGGAILFTLFLAIPLGETRAYARERLKFKKAKLKKKELAQAPSGSA